jgi:hypothetical protein
LLAEPDVIEAPNTIFQLDEKSRQKLTLPWLEPFIGEFDSIANLLTEKTGNREEEATCRGRQCCRDEIRAHHASSSAFIIYLCFHLLAPVSDE